MGGIRELMISTRDDFQLPRVQGDLVQISGVFQRHEFILIPVDKKAVPQARRGPEASARLQLSDEGVTQALRAHRIRPLGEIIQVRGCRPGSHRLDLEVLASHEEGHIGTQATPQEGHTAAQGRMGAYPLHHRAKIGDPLGYRRLG